MSETIRFRLAVRCEAAGRPNNEDNYHINADIAAGSKQFTGDEVLDLGAKGAVMVVCDGMGGMNAGEVASDIAVKTINAWFDTSHINDDVLSSDATRCDYIKRAIQAADANIKNESKADEAKSGMGSTIVMVWLLDGKAYVGWCGDSRAYKYNPNSGFSQMSHDHSYVQELVDAGKLAPELAFDHPNGNIITRSLGDPRGAAQPDVKVFNLNENDEILLCSDGLCGILRNNEIEQVLQSNTSSMNTSRDALWEAARAAGWHDNVTIVLAQIMPKHVQTPKQETPVQKQPKQEPKQKAQPIAKESKGNITKYIIIAACVIAVVIGILLIPSKKSELTPASISTEATDCNDPELNKAVDIYCNINVFELTADQLQVLDIYIYQIKNCEQLKKRVTESTRHFIQTIQDTDLLEKNEIDKYVERLRSINNKINN